MDPEVLVQLQRSRLFRNFDLKSLEADLVSCQILTLPKDAVLLQPGVLNTSLYFVISGEFIVTFDPLAVDVVATLRPSDCIGEVSFLDHNPPTTYVIAAVNSRVLVCPEAHMWKMLKRETEFPFNMLELLVERFREKNELLKTGLARVRHFQVRSEIDALTGIYNRSWCDEVFPHQMDLCERLGQPVCVAMLDMDHFKQVNDHYGHPAGDAVLRKAATLIRDQLRVTDLTARYGGEEFIVMLPATPSHEVMDKLNAVREHIQNTPFELPDGRSIQCTVSIGVVAWRAGLDLHALVSLADEALYQAKHQGRNQVVLAQNALTQRPSLSASKR
jgi:diguanylate cyclase (GGDEF)-like protein